jgi:hypothetical protein
MVVRRLVKLLSRRQAPPKVEPTGVAPKAVPPKTHIAPQVGAEVLIWESEVRAVAAETAAWTVETGGDLFGRWLDKTSYSKFLASVLAQRCRENYEARIPILISLGEFTTAPNLETLIAAQLTNHYGVRFFSTAAFHPAP